LKTLTCLRVLSDGVDSNFFIPRKWKDVDVRKVWKGLFVHPWCKPGQSQKLRFLEASPAEAQKLSANGRMHRNWVLQNGILPYEIWSLTTATSYR